MQGTYVVTGTVTDEHTVTLDESIPLTDVKVRVILEPLTKPPKRPVMEVMAEIWERQRKRGHKPRSREEIDAYIRQERDSWGDNHADLS